MKVEYLVERCEWDFAVIRKATFETGREMVSAKTHHADPMFAHHAAYQLALAERQRLGYEQGDERVMFPESPPSPQPASP